MIFVESINTAKIYRIQLDMSNGKLGPSDPAYRSKEGCCFSGRGQKEKPLDQVKTGALVREEVNALRNFAVYQTRKDIGIRCLQLFYIFLVF
jgi:hypothetical protein